jgi:hypothetical protein
MYAVGTMATAAAATCGTWGRQRDAASGGVPALVGAGADGPRRAPHADARSHGCSDSSLAASSPSLPLPHQHVYSGYVLNQGSRVRVGARGPSSPSVWPRPIHRTAQHLLALSRLASEMRMGREGTPLCIDNFALLPPLQLKLEAPPGIVSLRFMP